MKSHLLIRYCCLLLFCIGPFHAAFGQPAVSPNDQYRQISRLMAQQNYEQAIAESKALIEQSPNYHNAYFVLVWASSEAGQLDQTRVWLESLLGRAPPQPRAYIGLAHIREVKRDFGGAIENYLKCLRELPDEDRVAAMMAVDYVNQKKGEEAETFFKQLLTERPDSVAAHHGLGVLYLHLGRREEALRELDQVIALRPKNAAAYSYKGYVLAREGRYPQAIETLEICLRLLEASPDDALQRSVLNQLGDVYSRSGNYAQAARNFENVVALARASADLRSEEAALSQIASLHYLQNNYSQALDYWRRALDVSKTITSRKTRINTYPYHHIGNIGDVYDQLGDLPAAEQAYLESLTLSVEARDEANQSSVLQSLGDLYAKQGKLSQALSVAQQALALGEKRKDLANQLGALNSLSALYRQMGEAGKAMEYVQRSLKLLEGRPNPLWEGESFNNLGLLHLRFNELPQALSAFRKTLAIDPSTISPRIVWQAHSGLADTYVQLGQLDQAREHYQQAIEVMESVRARLGGEDEKVGFFQDKIEVFKKQVAVLLDPRLKGNGTDRAAEAFNYAERARARAFFDLLTEARVDVENITPDLLIRKQELQQRISQVTAQLIKERSQEPAKQDKTKIAQLDKSLSKADAELGDWLRDLRGRDPRYAALKYAEPVKLAETQRLLGSETVLISYSLAEPTSFLFAVSGNDFQVKRLPSEKTLRESVQKFLIAITDKNNPAPAEYRRQALQLSQQLLQPVSRMLSGKKALVIIADGPLHRLPFEALFLPGSTSTRGDFRQLPYLIRRFAVSYAPSASVLAELQNEQRKTAPTGFIAFGDPRYELRNEPTNVSTLRSVVAAGRINLQPLPYSREEVSAIAELFPDDERKLFLGDAATEENVKVPDRLSRYRLVHFSTHGYVNETKPRFSGLLLSQPQSGSGAEDGLLREQQSIFCSAS